MPHKTIANIVPVWTAYAISWILNLSIHQWMESIMILKELVALIGFALAAGYTIWKWRKEYKRKKEKET